MRMSLVGRAPRHRLGGAGSGARPSAAVRESATRPLLAVHATLTAIRRPGGRQGGRPLTANNNWPGGPQRGSWEAVCPGENPRNECCDGATTPRCHGENPVEWARGKWVTQEPCCWAPILSSSCPRAGEANNWADHARPRFEPDHPLGTAQRSAAWPPLQSNPILNFPPLFAD